MIAKADSLREKVVAIYQARGGRVAKTTRAMGLWRGLDTGIAWLNSVRDVGDTHSAEAAGQRADISRRSDDVDDDDDGNNKNVGAAEDDEKCRRTRG
jgi:hypothetical protein